MKLALLVPGQGTQHPAMLPWLGHGPASVPLAQLAQALGSNWPERLGDRPWVTQNKVAQALITALALAAWERLRPLLPTPVAVAGYSVGEVAAFCIAGVYPPEQAMAMAQFRAQAMDAAMAQQAPGGLMALHGMPAQGLPALLQHHGLALAIALGPDKCIVGGPCQALDTAQSEWTRQGLVCTRLGVHVPSHTPWLTEAATRLQGLWAQHPFEAPHMALVCNAEGDVLRRPDALRQALAQQIAQTVHWDRCMDALAERRPDCVLEMGPGHSLSRLWTERHPDIPARSVDEFQSCEAIAAWVGRHGGQA